MVKDRSTVIFYPATVCNLNCRYCSIDKNPALIQIDKILEESSEPWVRDRIYVKIIDKMKKDGIIKKI